MLKSEDWTLFYKPPASAMFVLACCDDEAVFMCYYDGQINGFVDKNEEEVDVDYWMPVPLSYYQMKIKEESVDDS